MRHITFNSSDAEGRGMEPVETTYWSVGMDGEDVQNFSLSYVVGGLMSPVVLGICWAKDTTEARDQLKTLGIPFQDETDEDVESRIG